MPKNKPLAKPSRRVPTTLVFESPTTRANTPLTEATDFFQRRRINPRGSGLQFVSHDTVTVPDLTLGQYQPHRHTTISLDQTRGKVIKDLKKLARKKLVKYAKRRGLLGIAGTIGAMRNAGSSNKKTY